MRYPIRDGADRTEEGAERYQSTTKPHAKN